MIEGDEGVSPEGAPQLAAHEQGAGSDDRTRRRMVQFCRDYDIRMVHSEATALDVRLHAVRVADGSSHKYDSPLLLATGAKPRVFNIPGHDLPHVHVLRSLADCRDILARAAHAERVVVMDASVIGLELSASLRNLGLTVHVIDPDDNPLVGLLGKELGALIQQLHEEHGITLLISSRR